MGRPRTIRSTPYFARSKPSSMRPLAIPIFSFLRPIPPHALLPSRPRPFAWKLQATPAWSDSIVLLCCLFPKECNACSPYASKKKKSNGHRQSSIAMIDALEGKEGKEGKEERAVYHVSFGQRYR